MKHYSETRMTASVLKKIKSKHIKGSKERYLLGQKHNLQIFGAIPFIKLQNDLAFHLMFHRFHRLTVV